MKNPIAFGKYLLLERINVGGMAEVFLARSRGLHGFKRFLAIKKILPTMAEDKEFIQMFIDEAKIASELNHASIVQIYELGKYYEDYYIAMEFVHGKDLRHIQERLMQRNEPIPLELAALVALRICEALDYAHNKTDPSGRPLGIIHRDISPQNVIISYEGEIKICDFGIAKAANRSQKTQAGVLKGKFGYMSPEQVRGLPLDGRSDLFTVGTLLYEMVTLKRLFLGESDFSTLEKVRNADVVPPSTYNHDVPEELEEIILTALAKDVEDRFQNAGEFAEKLQQFITSRGIVSPRDLGRYLKDLFRSEYEAELKRLEYYQNLPEEIIAEAEREAARKRKGGAGGDSVAAVEEDEAKTQIFTSSAPDQAPPLPQPERQPAQLADAHTMIFEESGQDAGDGIAGEKTMIFQEEEDLEEASTLLYEDSEQVRQAISARIEGAQAQPSQPPRRGGILVAGLVALCAMLLGWASYATWLLVQNKGKQSVSSLEILCDPPVGITVELDGKKLSGMVPISVNHLAPGAHTLVITKPGYRGIRRRLEVPPGAKLVLDVSLQRLPVPEKAPKPKLFAGTSGSRATVPSLAEAGGKTTQAGSGVALPVDSGGGGKGGGEAKASAAGKAQAKKASLRITSKPRAAAVFSDGKLLGKTPLKLSGLEPGRFELVVKRRGYRAQRKTVQLRPGKELALNIVLQREKRRSTPKPPVQKPIAPVVDGRGGFGYLVANTRPWSKVYVDGKYTGRDTPIPPDKKLKLKAGKHRITFETPSGRKFHFEVVIEADKTTKLIKKLEG